MAFESSYISKRANDEGRFVYTPDEDAVWRDLITRQDGILETRALPEVIVGLERLALPRDRVPQVLEVDARLRASTGFGVEAVPAMISDDAFFDLLARRRFPVATFVRSRDELDYLTEPDIFHEVYGHCPLLTDPRYCEAVQCFGEAAAVLGRRYYEPLQRLFWFTIEFGLTETPAGLKIYGAGITSSAKESVYCLEADHVDRRPFDPVEICATDYRIDVLQPRYYVLDEFTDLFRFSRSLVRNLPQWCAAAASTAA